MGFLDNSETAPVIKVKLTSKGKELLSKGLKDQDMFDVIKFSFGDSEIDYSLPVENIQDLKISEPDINTQTIRSKLYYSGDVPIGTPQIVLSSASGVVSTYGSVDVNVYTLWSPVSGKYSEQYNWINIGPLEDYDFSLEKSVDTSSVKISAYDVTGSTRIKIQGQTSNAYSIFDLIIE